MKYLAFRFDVDTHKCILEGVPNLIKLADRNNIKFTFFIHPGRAVDQRSFIKNKLHSHGEIENHSNLSAFYKLGLKDYLITSIINPQISRVGREVIKKCIDNGFEVGLHGGTNHELWNSNALKWKKSDIKSEITWGVRQFNKISPKYKIISFASPHWKSNEKICEVLKHQGFKYISDIHTDTPVQKIKRSFRKINNIPVNISGEPGGVGYLEWCRAKGFSDKKIISDFYQKLKVRNNFAIIYDHPYYSGVKEIATLGKMIETAKRMGFKIVTIEQIYNYFYQ